MKGLWEKHPDRSPESRIQSFGEQHPSFRSKGMKEYRKKGRESLNPLHKGRDNEVMEGKGEKELS